MSGVSGNRETSAFSPTSGKAYPSWEALVDAESNGYVAVAVISSRAEKHPWPWILGPFSSQREASNARARLRTRFKRENRGGELTAKFYVRPAWKEV